MNPFKAIYKFLVNFINLLLGKEKMDKMPEKPKVSILPPVNEEKEKKKEDEKVEYQEGNLSDLLAAWGTDNKQYDLNNDGTVDGADLGLFLLKKPVERDLLLYPHHGTLSSRYFRSKGIGNPERYEINKQIENEEKMDIVARTRLGAEHYYIWYASWDLGHGNKTGSLSIDTDKIIEDVLAFYGDKEPEGYGQLDYEGDFFRGLDAGKGTEEHAEATKVMISALRIMKKEFPKMKWTYYGLPILKYWLPHPSPTNSYHWGNAPDDIKQEEISFKFLCYMDLMVECDWLNPSSYNRYDPDAFDHDILVREVPYRKELVKFCHMFNTKFGTDKPIIPMIGPLYAPGGRAEWKNKVVQNDFIEKATLLPYLEGDINGLATWYAHTYYVGLAIPGQGRTPDASWKNAFVKNYNLEESKIPWEYGSASEPERVEARNTLTGLLSRSIYDHLEFTRKTMDNFYS